MSSSAIYTVLRSSRLASAFALTAGLSLYASFASAGQRPDGQFFFDHAPRLLRTETSAIATTYTGGTTYQFVVAVPQDAGAPLQAITITQDANPSAIEFNVNQSQAIALNGDHIALASVGGTKGRETTIAFAQPIQPGETVTVLLKTDRNPSSEGAYLFGITVYPVGDQSNGLFLGYGRVRVYSHNG